MKENKNIFRRFNNFSIKRRVAKIKRKKSTVNFTTAKTALILIDGLAAENNEHIFKFVTFLNENNIETTQLFFFNMKEKVENNAKENVFHFSKKDTDITGKPKSQLVNTILQKEFDLLFDFSIEKYFFLNYITALSKAKLKIGLYSDALLYFDLMINLGEDVSMDKYIKEVKFYLQNLKS